MTSQSKRRRFSFQEEAEEVVKMSAFPREILEEERGKNVDFTATASAILLLE
jgi:hypothetical protein